MNGALYLSGLDSRFSNALVWLDNWLSDYGVELRIVSGFRSLQEQEALYAQGRTSAEIRERVHKQGRGGAVTDAPPGQSAHNYGLAVDLDPDDPNTPTIREIAKLFGFGTVSWDPDHLEYPNWRQTAGL
jgi:uncharacterized protein YcbK (DUF882 family)